jgi:Fe-S cluster assembly ATP-binding protein
MARMCARDREVDVPALARRVHFDSFLGRDVNAGFSGGEIKRSELLQLMAQQPDIVLFDEPESGVDLENMSLVGNTVRYLLDGMPDACQATLHERKRLRRTGGLIITHTGHILEYVTADRAQVMYNGRLACEARPREILDHIAKYGYQECLRCFAGNMRGKILEAPLI